MIRRNFFIKKNYVVALCVLIFLSWVIVISPYHLVPIFICIVLLFLYRKKTISWKENLKNDGTILLSPVAGVVVSINDFYSEEEKQHYSELRIVLSPQDYWGLHLPYSSEMEYLKSQRGKFYPRKDLEQLDVGMLESMTKTDLTLRSKYGLSTKMVFLHSRFGKSPKIWMKSGDRGRGAACFGHYPFGGSLLMYIQKPCDVLIVKGEQLEPGTTVLAVVKKGNEV